MDVHRLWTVGILGLAVIAGASATGCTGPNHPERVGGSTSRSLVTGIKGHARFVDGVIQLRAQGAIDVDIDSIGGDIAVIGNPKLEATTVEIVREAQHGYLRGIEPDEALTLIDWTAELMPGPGPLETLNIKTAYNGPEAWFMRTHIRIETPDLASIRIKSRTGSVEIINNTGSADIHTTDGDILLATVHPQRGNNTLIGSEGDIDYRVPKGSTGTFDVEVIEGSVLTRITAGQWRYEDEMNRVNKLTATLNSGENPVVIRTTEGDVRIAVVKNPMGFGPIRSGI